MCSGAERVGFMRSCILHSMVFFMTNPSAIPGNCDYCHTHDSYVYVSILAGRLHLCSCVVFEEHATIQGAVLRTDASFARRSQGSERTIGARFPVESGRTGKACVHSIRWIISHML